MFIKTNKRKFVLNNKEIILKGFGVGTWLNIEHFMFGLPGSDESIRKSLKKYYGDESKTFFEQFQSSFICEEDIKYLYSIGVNFIRVPINHRLFQDDNTGEQIETGFHYLDDLIEYCKMYNVFILLDMHTSPGGQNPDWHSDNSFGVPLFWKYKALRMQLVTIWSRIAERYKDEEIIMGYDLLNEPAFAQWEALNDFYMETTAAIRKVDKNHVIVLEGDQFSMDFSGLELPDDDNLAIGFHYYPTVWHPDLLSDDMNKMERKNRIKHGFDKIIDNQSRLNVPFFCGEYGYGKDCGNMKKRMELTVETAEIFNDEGIGWLLWDYKDADFMSIAHPSFDSKWMNLYRKVEEFWNQDIEKNYAYHLCEQIENEFALKLSSNDKYIIQFKIRAMLYEAEGNQIFNQVLKEYSIEDLINAAKDFEFKNCKIEQEIEAIIKKII